MIDDDMIINPDVVSFSKEDVKKNLEHYRKTLSYMGANVPIQVLCLPKSLEKSLIRARLVRVYDLISCNLAEIEGIGPKSLDLLASRLDEFFSVSI